METREQAPQEAQSIEEAVSRLLDGNQNAAIEFLRANPDDVSEFCLQVRDKYGDKDSTTPIMKLSMIIEKLL